MNDTAFLPFSRPSLSEEEIQEITECLRSGWLTTGPRTKKFEEMLKHYLQTPEALALTSATAGLQLALSGIFLQAEDEVIVPAMTFVASLNTIVQAGGKPVIVDIDLKTYNLCPERLKTAITAKTRAIMPVHFAGLAVDMQTVYAVAEQYQLRVIEDAAQAIGTKYQDQLIGSFGDTQVFSFHPNKNMTTGEGGCVSTRDKKLADYIKIMRFHGIDREFSRFDKNSALHYDVIAPGFKYNMLDIQAALGIHQLPKLGQFNARRKALAQRYYQLLADIPELILPIDPDSPEAAGHAWHLYLALLKIEKIRHLNLTRDDFIEKMKNIYHIGLGFHYDPPHLYRFYQEKYGYQKGDFPNAEFMSERVISLPLFASMTDADQDRVVLAIKKILSG